MLKIKNLNVLIETTHVLHSIDIEIEGFVSIVGRNGAGKTTLMRSIMGILNIKSGSIHFNNIKISDEDTYKRASMGIGYMPEDRKLVPDLTVKENILLPYWALGEYNKNINWIIDFIPELKSLLKLKANSLSGGQQKLVALARELTTGNKLLLLDEPFEGVAPALANRIFGLIKNLRRENLNVIITESDATHSSKVAEKIYNIERGEIKLKV